MLIWCVLFSLNEYHNQCVQVVCSILDSRVHHPYLTECVTAHRRAAQATRHIHPHLMGAEADALCGAGYWSRSTEHTSFRNGYRHRQFDTRAGSWISRSRHAATYFPDWLLERLPTRRTGSDHGEVATCYLLGVSDAADGQAGGDPGDHVAVEVQVSVMARNSTPPSTLHPAHGRQQHRVLWPADALVLKVREGEALVNMHALIAGQGQRRGHREILGIDVSTAEDRAGWLTFWC